MNIIEAQDACSQDKQLIGFIRSIKFGEITIKIINGKPVIIEKSMMAIKLENHDEMEDRKTQN